MVLDSIARSMPQQPVVSTARKDPLRAGRFLSGLRYPALKEHALRHARQAGADERVLHALSALPDGIYESPVSLSRACRTTPT